MTSDPGKRGRLQRAAVGRCVLEERLAELLAATEVSNIDLSAFYTPEDLALLLACDVRTLERRREQLLPPLWVPVGRLVRYPAFFFWAWVAEEIIALLGLDPDASREPPRLS